MQAINHPDTLAEQMADEYIIKNAKRINQRLWELALLTDKLNELETTPGQHHLRRQIAESVDPKTMKMVALEIIKEGKSMSCRIAASALARADDSDYSLWQMDATGRASFVTLYGNWGRLLLRIFIRSAIRRRYCTSVRSRLDWSVLHPGYDKGSVWKNLG